ncbi:hypothetical protein BV22DRAFT_1009547 [Leucogyrophana mollusca]|uniref:Uncharacterized protein n=1 Tax=Leucogyrophana mollusca TaxID=85980 RepID=A0ACB8BKJ9_9AGAM|nr:hypothetical protein BV22DRAFT_1009547 [Leucogyrophana mollusca]
MNSNDTDLSSELLVAQLLEQDLLNLRYAQEAEKLQLEAVISVSALKSGKLPKFSKNKKAGNVIAANASVITSDDADIAMELFLADARTGGDRAFAESLQVAQDASVITGRHFAQKLAAEEKKFLLDAEFARRLQNANDNGELDMDSVKDAESLLGRDTVDKILAADPNEKGKNKAEQGKGKASGDDMEFDEDMHDVKPTLAEDLPLCGICYEPFKATHSPVTASQSATSSNRLQFGLCLPCPNQHSYCLSCLASYIQTKLDPEGEGGGNPEVRVFPIKCPECPPTQWEDGISDDIAQRVLSEKNMVLWHRQRLLDSIERHYCPNPRCSALVQVHDDPNEPMASCPSCSEVMCVPCRVTWHNEMTCEEYQALPDDEKSPEDQLVFLLAKAKKWRRCPKCAVLVELTHGCNHITCFCGTHFCFKCGSLWDKVNTRCTRVPSCELWDEENLLEQRERERQRQADNNQRQQLVQPQPAPAPPPPYFPPQYVPPHMRVEPQYVPPHMRAEPQYVPLRTRAAELEWMHDPNIVCGRHPFTTDMIRSLVCGYCNARANSMADLLYHLSHVTHHAVFACCGRFFAREVDFDRHCQAQVHRFGGHVHTVDSPARVP